MESAREAAPEFRRSDCMLGAALQFSLTAWWLQHDDFCFGRHPNACSAAARACGRRPRVAVFVLLLPLAATAVMRRRMGLNRTWTYWSMVFALNALGTALGDFLASDPVWGIGLHRSMLLSGVILAMLLFATTLHDGGASPAK